MTGTSPFARDTTAATIWAVLHADVPTPRTQGPLGAVIGGMLQRDPRARLGGPQAAALLAGPSAGPAGPGTATTPVIRGTAQLAALPEKARRRRWWPGVAVAALLLGLAGGGYAGSALLGTRPPEAVTLTYGDGGEVPLLERSSAYPCTIIAPAPGKGIETNSGVACAERHEAEWFGEVELYSTNEVFGYPGEQQLRALGASTCRFYFDSPLVVGQDKSRLEVVALVPAAAEFEKDYSTSPGYHQYKGRVLHCALRSAEGAQIEGSRVVEQPS